MKALTSDEKKLLNGSVFASSGAVAGDVCPGGDGYYPNCGQTQQPPQQQPPQQQPPQQQPPQQQPPQEIPPQQQPPQTQQPPPPSTSNSQCPAAAAKVDSLTKSLIAAGAQNPSPTDCSTNLFNFVATVKGANNYSYTQDTNGVGLGTGCKYGKALAYSSFDSFGLRADDISSTAICKTGTSGECVSWKSGFIAEITWNAPSVVGRTINYMQLADGSTLSNQELACVGTGETSSPLIIEEVLGRKILTSHRDATDTFFDIKGDGIKRRISCVRDGFFVALPTAKGEIKSVHQLFGNNTSGLDKFKNGFIALTVHDLNKDGVIDEKDAVFKRLKLWKDENCNGVAEAREQHELSRLDVKSIVLQHEEMLEKDENGNLSLQRSVVRRSKDKDVLRIFDVWFQFN